MKTFFIATLIIIFGSVTKLGQPFLIPFVLVFLLYRVLIVSRVRLLVGREANQVKIRNPFTRLKNSLIGVTYGEARRITEREVQRRRITNYTQNPEPYAISDTTRYLGKHER